WCVTVLVGHAGVTAFKTVSVVSQERDLRNLQELDLSGTGESDVGLVHLKTSATRRSWISGRDTRGRSRAWRPSGRSTGPMCSVRHRTGRFSMPFWTTLEKH